MFTFTELLEALGKVWKNASRLHLVLLTVAAIALFGAGAALGNFWEKWGKEEGPRIEPAPVSGTINYTVTTRIEKPSSLQSAISQFVQVPGQEFGVAWVTTDELAAGKPTAKFTADVTSNLGGGIECLGFLSYPNGALLELPQSSSGQRVTLTGPAADGHVRLLLVVRLAKAPTQEVGQTPITVRFK